MKNASYLVVTIFAFAVSPANADELPRAADLLAAFQKSVEKLDRVRIECTEGPPENEKAVGMRRSIESIIIRDSARWKTDQVWRSSWLDDGVESHSTRWLQSLVGCEMIQPHEFVQAQVHSERFSSSANVTVSAFLDNHDDRVWTRMGLSCVVFGRLPGDGGVPLWLIMTDASALELLPEKETVAGAETYILKSRGKYGEHKVWLDPRSGGLPRRMEIHKQVGDLSDDEQLGSRAVRQVDPKADPPVPPPSEMTRRIDNIRIENKGGVFVITGFDHDFRVRFPGDRESAAAVVYRLHSIDIEPKTFPEGTFRFDAKIPQGRPVHVWENAPLQFIKQGAKTLYEWKDGKIQRRLGN